MTLFDQLKAIPKVLTLRSTGGRAGQHREDTATMWTTPWAWRDEGGLYLGWNKEAWLYFQVPVNPLLWEDPGYRLDTSAPLQQLLSELGDTHVDNSMGISLLANARNVHVLSISWEEPGQPPEGTTDELAEFQSACLDFLIPHKALFVGVQLRSETALATIKYKGWKGLMEQAKDLGTKALGEDVPDRAMFEKDRVKIERILRRHGAHPPQDRAAAQLEAWYNLGRSPDVVIQVADESLYVADFDRLEFSAVVRFREKTMEAPYAQWALDAATHASGPKVISIRGELQAPSIARNRARSAQRRIKAQMDEEMATGDLERVEDTVAYQQAQHVEEFIALGQSPLFANTSILMCRRVGNEDEETYMDELRSMYGIEMKPLVMRQLEALDETLPCSSRRLNPFLQDLSLEMVAYCGLQAWSNIGDRSGAFIGLADPDYTPVWLDFFGAPTRNEPPAMGIFGEPGSGKTYLCQLIATQATLAGHQVIFINPKGFSTLAPFAELVDGAVVKMSELEESRSGYFDPFRFAEPEMAAEIATTFILQVLGNTGVAGMGFNAEQELKLGAGLKRGAKEGARCVMDALQYVDDIDVRRMVVEQIQSSALFSIGISTTPAPRYQGRKGLTLIEFDRKLDFPEKGKSAATYSRSERISLAAVRLVTRASMEILVGSGGGVMVVDEAWTFLSSSEGLAALQQIGREGRSLNLLPIFATQRVDDLLRDGVDMEGYMSRVMVMKLTDAREARAALTLCGLEPTEDRVRWLRAAGPKDGRPAMGLHRDLTKRHAAVYIGPVPPAAHVAYTTNPTERRELGMDLGTGTFGDFEDTVEQVEGGSGADPFSA
jgi:hypothetical protein